MVKNKDVKRIKRKAVMRADSANVITKYNQFKSVVAQINKSVERGEFSADVIAEKTYGLYKECKDILESKGYTVTCESITKTLDFISDKEYHYVNVSWKDNQKLGDNSKVHLSSGDVDIARMAYLESEREQLLKVIKELNRKILIGAYASMRIARDELTPNNKELLNMLGYDVVEMGEVLPITVISLKDGEGRPVCINIEV